ncbi:MAG: hypothetical protein II723_07755, partial [Oscillospiraceae bacterium]|nr:hypothetical protein [Oscillospiraceae bacterium]
LVYVARLSYGATISLAITAFCAFLSRLDMYLHSFLRTRFGTESQGFFLVALFNFQGAVLLTILPDSLFIIAHFNRFVKPFSKVFSENFLFPVDCARRLCDSLFIISHPGDLVK